MSEEERLRRELTGTRILLAICVQQLGGAAHVSAKELEETNEAFLWTQVPGVDGARFILRYREGDDGTF